MSTHGLEYLGEGKYQVHPPFTTRWFLGDLAYSKSLRLRQKFKLILLMPFWNAMQEELAAYRRWFTASHAAHAKKQSEKVHHAFKCTWEPYA